jgi:hypothetical protein
LKRRPFSRFRRSSWVRPVALRRMSIRVVPRFSHQPGGEVAWP